MKISIIGQVLGKFFIFGKYASGVLKFAFKNTLKCINYVLRHASYILNLFLPRKMYRVHKVGKIDNANIQHWGGNVQTIDDGVQELGGEIQALLTYKDPSIKRLIWDFKYYLKPHALKLCADLMYDELVANMSDRVNNIPFSKPYIVVHCPSSTFFKGEKKFDHMKVLLCQMEKCLDTAQPFFVACTHAIMPNSTDSRVSETFDAQFGAKDEVRSKNVLQKSQHLGTRAERLTWAKERFQLSEEFIRYVSYNRHDQFYDRSYRRDYIYCIDDVTTTGASFGAVRDLISKETGFKTKCIALSH